MKTMVIMAGEIIEVAVKFIMILIIVLLIVVLGGAYALIKYFFKL